ncbi:hypothetical protein DPMN_063253 [Dreissena polymorpha]|uniref:Uncharacterized protein n=1 Tax=Dreissena polymorpha TaxID=45954 RepID=A0A9D4CA59_DREPO|nr:hypothetical protein DPMN_063253 [Dreissena polymorpha]
MNCRTTLCRQFLVFSILSTADTKREEAVGGMEEEEMELQCGIADLRPAKQTIIGDEKEMQPFMQPFSYSNCESGYV